MADERLTGKDEQGYYAPRDITLNYLKQRGELTDRLAYYEDSEEQGRFVVLPCKVGDTMYCDGKYFARHCAGEVMEFSVDRIETTVSNLFRGEVDVQFDFDDFGKIVFLTREEAEKALEGREDNATD